MVQALKALLLRDVLEIEALDALEALPLQDVQKRALIALLLHNVLDFIVVPSMFYNMGFKIRRRTRRKGNMI